MTELPTTADAVAASVACARELGLPADDPEVIAEGYSVRVRLRPAPVVTRVVTHGRVLRPGRSRGWSARSASRGSWRRRVCRSSRRGPTRDRTSSTASRSRCGAGPSTRRARSDPVTFGTMLGELHTALASYDADLPALVGPLTDIATALTLSDDPVLHQAAHRLVPLALSWPRRPLHGDAHTGNVLITADGPRWTDFEDVCAGPAEWDLASLTLTDEAVAAYPGPVDAARLDQCRDLRRLQVLASLLADGADDHPLGEELAAALTTMST